MHARTHARTHARSCSNQDYALHPNHWRPQPSVPASTIGHGMRPALSASKHTCATSATTSMHAVRRSGRIIRPSFRLVVWRMLSCNCSQAVMSALGSQDRLLVILAFWHIGFLTYQLFGISAFWHIGFLQHWLIAYRLFTMVH
jgi:hypothetical protein